GWEDDSGQTVTEITKGSTGHKVFTATWKDVRIFHITYTISNGGQEGADWDSRTLEYTPNDDIILPTVSNPNLTFKGWKIRTSGGTTLGDFYSGKIDAGTLTGDIELVTYYVVTVTFETESSNLYIHNVLGTDPGVNYLEYEIGDKLAKLLSDLSSDTGEDKFSQMWYYDEQDEPVDITDTYQEFKVTKNITLWVLEATGGGGPGMS
ncbi:MAG: hypothetical protein MR497_04505, partial [Bacilli bacterium]|nr:hypothetical protein [Bacilli bacterium]